MKALIISIGDEVLYGKIVNTNAAYLSKQLTTIGYDVISHYTVGDSYPVIYDIVKNVLVSDIDVVITTGGLGPTHDDFTKKVLADALGLELIYYPEAFEHFDQYFKKRNIKTFNSNMSQAYFPKGSRLIPNNRGTALGAIINHNHKKFIILVGPPYEMNEMFENTVKPFLEENYPQDYFIEEYYAMGGGESEFEDLLKNLMKAHPNVVINPYASRGTIRYLLRSLKANIEEFHRVEQQFLNLLGDHIVGRANKEVEEYVFDQLYANKQKISIAESCTGGMFTSKLINVSGASMVFDEGYITYSNQSKTKNLGIPKSLINAYGAVSAEVAEAMAIGVKKKANSSVGVGITGIAGPNGGTPLKPVGLVYFSFVIDDYVYVEKKIFNGAREDIRIRSTMYIMWRLLVELKNRNNQQ